MLDMIIDALEVREQAPAPPLTQPLLQAAAEPPSRLVRRTQVQPDQRDQAKVQELSNVMMACHDAVMPLLQPNVREHNWQRLTTVFEA